LPESRKIIYLRLVLFSHLKLLIATPSQGHYGGIEAFVIALASAVKEWPEFELQVVFKLVQNLELKNDLKAAAAPLNCPVHFVPSGDSRLLKFIRWADLVHGQNTSPDIIFPAWFLRKKLVLTIHNWRRRNLGIHSILWGFGARLAQRRWYNSKFVWNTWEPNQKRRGSDCVPTVCRFPKTWCLPAERKGFLFVGRWIENKGIEELVTAYSRAKLDSSRWPLTLIGDGPLKPKIEGLIKDLNVQGIEMPGFIDDQSKAQRLASARWLVAPARTREDLGLTPIEGRSAGVPAIVTRDGGLPEAGGETALIVEPGNIEELTEALKRAAAMNDDEYRDRAERGRDTLKDFLRPMEFYRESYTAVFQGI
jgi:glycosyltransferase involved in cell wall biosynthesis